MEGAIPADLGGANLARRLLKWDRMESRSIYGCLLALVGVCACGGTARVDRTGVADETAGSNSAGANSAGGPGAGAAGSGGARDANTCAEFHDDSPQSASVVIVNDTLAAIYLGSRSQLCGTPPLYDVHDASNAVVARHDSCGTPCQSWLAGEPTGGCTAICNPSEVTKLDVGERIVLPWSGLYRLDVQLPKACNGAQLGGEAAVDCSVEKRVEPGDYTFYAVAGTDYRCNDNSSICGECAPSATGGCTLRDAMVTGPEASTELAVRLDPGYGISGSAGSAPMTGKPLPIELVFRGPR